MVAVSDADYQKAFNAFITNQDPNKNIELAYTLGTQLNDQLKKSKASFDESMTKLKADLDAARTKEQTLTANQDVLSKNNSRLEDKINSLKIVMEVQAQLATSEQKRREILEATVKEMERQRDLATVSSKKRELQSQLNQLAGADASLGVSGGALGAILVSGPIGLLAAGAFWVGGMALTKSDKDRIALELRKWNLVEADLCNGYSFDFAKRYNKVTA